MKTKLLIVSVLVMLLTNTSTEVYAAKKMFGKLITYNGKIDDAGKPKGKGKLVTEYQTINNDMKFTHRDILEGTFEENGDVSNAKLLLDRYNGPLYINSAVFKGTLAIEISENGDYVKYTLKEGELRDHKYRDITITPDSPFEIIRKPQPYSCELLSGTIKLESKAIDENTKNALYKFLPNGYAFMGNAKEFLSNIKLNNNFEFIKDNYQTIVFDNGNILSVEKQNNTLFVGIAYSNGDFFRWNDNSRYSGSLHSLRKKLPEATIEILVQDFDNIRSTILYSDKSLYTGTITIGDYIDLKDFYNRFNAATTISDRFLAYNTGTLIKGGKETKYINGKTEAEIAAANEARQKRLEKQEKEEARELEKRKQQSKAITAELNKKYGKKMVDAANKGQILVGMHEDLVALICLALNAKMEMTADYGSAQVYDIKAIRDVYDTYKYTWIGTVHVRNHKVTSVRYGSRWSH